MVFWDGDDGAGEDVPQSFCLAANALKADDRVNLKYDLDLQNPPTYQAVLLHSAARPAFSFWVPPLCWVFRF